MKSTPEMVINTALCHGLQSRQGHIKIMVISLRVIELEEEIQGYGSGEFRRTAKAAVFGIHTLG